MSKRVELQERLALRSGNKQNIGLHWSREHQRLEFSSEKSLGMPGRGGHGEPPVQGFSLLRAAPTSP
jgi:hypothetical protein